MLRDIFAIIVATALWVVIDTKFLSRMNGKSFLRIGISTCVLSIATALLTLDKSFLYTVIAICILAIIVTPIYLLVKLILRLFGVKL